MLVLLLVCIQASALAASFDCAKARSGTEVLICSDPALGLADERMAAAYKAALVRTSNRATLVNIQRDWLSSFEVTSCKDAACLLKSFLSREAALHRVVADHGETQWTGTYVRVQRGRIDPTATISLVTLGRDRLLVSGTAYWVGANPGQVNDGQLDGEAVRTQNRAVLDADGCRAQLAMQNQRLVVDSESGCGGLNVSFEGEYQRK